MHEVVQKCYQVITTGSVAIEARTINSADGVQGNVDTSDRERYLALEFNGWHQPMEVVLLEAIWSIDLDTLLYRNTV